ncbi:MAG: T9SS type A sorting domain-containing protein, partial [candidate division WOR-3 bacterium]
LPGARKLGIKALPTHLVLEKIKIFNIAGGCVLSTSITTTNRNKEEFTIFPLNLQPGVYFVRLEPQALRAKLVVR